MRVCPGTSRFSIRSCRHVYADQELSSSAPPARAGDISAAKLLLSYQLGKPAPAPNPDQIDRDEWEHFQRDTIKLVNVQRVLGSFPASVGNDIARTALPSYTQVRKE